MIRQRAVCVGALCAMAAYASIFGNVRGIVHDPSHRPIQGAQVVVRSLSEDWTKTAASGAEGEFQLPAVPVGRYRVTATRDGFAATEEDIVVSSGSAPVLHLQLGMPVLSQSVEVSETADTVTPDSGGAATTLIERSQIQRTPGADRTNSLAVITEYVPGAYVTHDQLHIRGGHQVSWLVDGVPVPNTNIASNAGPQFDPKDADAIEVQRGGYSAEYGDRAYGVFNVIPRTGFERNNDAEVVASFGSFGQTNDQISFGGHSERLAYYASLNGNRTGLGLETPAPAAIHDDASGLGGFGTIVYNAGAADQLRLVTSLRRDDYQIPNTPEQQADGTRDNENEADAFVNFSWVHTAGSGVLLTVSPFYHFNRADYMGGPNDLPVSPRQQRSSQYAGAQATLSVVKGRHNARVGTYDFFQQDDELFGLTGPETSLTQRQRPSGSLEAAFVEDQYKLTQWLTLTGGVRLTHFAGGLSENAASPRAAAAILIPRLKWVLHGFYGRYYQAPPLSTVAGPLLALAAQEGFGFLPLRGERDEQRQFGLTVPVRGWTIDVDNFLTRARNYFDHDVLGNSNVFFPLTIDSARISGWEATLRSPWLFHRGQIHAVYSRQRAEGQGAVNGGLTDFSPPGGVFLLDHDQRHTLNAGFNLKLPWRAWASGNVYYGSGFADENGPAHLPGHTTLDLMLSKSVGERCSVSINVLNVANRRYLLDNSATFGGTHFGDPREVFVQVRYRFHY
jgi:outer membrane receptor protein involved in Fe transport